jgi:hypothetical protein
MEGTRMTIKAASERTLGELHSRVAKVMVGALDVYDTAQEVYLEKAAQGDTTDVIVPEVNASLLSVITKFLADNSITCVPEESEELTGLHAKLKEKRQNRKTVSNVVHLTG